jgi:hypothetical protein
MIARIRDWTSRWAFPGVLWCCVFLAINLANLKGGGTNPDSRYALMASIVDGHTLSIDRYLDWSDDWAQAPNGHYYSNKAPGPALVAAPLLMALDPFHEKSPTGESRLARPALAAKTLICLIFQMLPFCLLTLLSLELLKKWGVSLQGRVFTALALLFGNTAALFMSSYFGHAFAACALLAALLAIDRRSYRWVGFFFGMAVLSDYGGIFLIPALLVALWVRQRSARSFADLFVGALLPAIVWCAYHTICYGKPWALPFKYYNPRWLVPAPSEHKIWGVAGLVPDAGITWKLLFSPERGVLFTQPWVYVVFAASFWGWRLRELRAWIVFGVLGFLGLLWMNASFGAWHGGGSPGPRYMSMIFPMLAVPGGVLLDRVPQLRLMFWVTLAVSVGFFAISYCGDLSAPHDVPLWRFYWNTLWDGWYRVHLVTLAYVSGLLIWALRRSLGTHAEIA